MVLMMTMSGISQGSDQLLNFLDREGILTELFLDNLTRSIAENYLFSPEDESQSDRLQIKDERELEKVRRFIEKGRKRIKKKNE
jgi:hypothetical protein